MSPRNSKKLKKSSQCQCLDWSGLDCPSCVILERWLTERQCNLLTSTSGKVSPDVQKFKFLFLLDLIHEDDDLILRESKAVPLPASLVQALQVDWVKQSWSQKELELIDILRTINFVNFMFKKTRILHQMNIFWLPLSLTKGPGSVADPCGFQHCAQRHTRRLQRSFQPHFSGLFTSGHIFMEC